jgi:hypothetical protein
MMEGKLDPLPIDSDRCDICLDAEEEKIRNSQNDQMCDLGCKYHPLKTICNDCPSGTLLALVDKKRDKLFELTSTHTFPASE